MVRQICVHYNDKISSRVFNTVNVSRSQAEFPFSRPQEYPVLAVEFLQLFRHLQGAVRWAIVDNNDLVGYTTAIKMKKQT